MQIFKFKDHQITRVTLGNQLCIVQHKELIWDLHHKKKNQIVRIKFN